MGMLESARRQLQEYTGEDETPLDGDTPAWAVSLVIHVAVLVSLSFAGLHGLEWYRLVLQAMGGIVLSAVFLKASAMDGRRWLAGLGTAFTAHLAFNTIMLIGMRAAQSFA